MSEGQSPSLFSVLSNPKIEYNIGLKKPEGIEVTGRNIRVFLR
jgi:hypothetical protein